MDIKNLEAAIVNRLKTTLPDLLVEAYPDNPSTFKMIHPKGAVLIHYSGSKFNSSLFEEVIIQERKLTYDLIILNRSLRSNGGIYETMDKIRESLTGYQYDPTTKFYPIDEEFILEENGLWQYAMRFETKTKHLESGYEI